MHFKQFYTWIKYKTLPPSFLAKNRFFVERDSKKLRVFNNIGLTFRNERWTNWETSHVDWTWVDLFILIMRYVGGFVFGLLVWYFWFDFFSELPLFNKVAYKLWGAYDFFNYYSLYLVWILLLMRSFIWDTFIVVFFSGTAKHYYPLARREEAARQLANQMPLVAKLIHSKLPRELHPSSSFMWTLLSNPSYKCFSLHTLNYSRPDQNVNWLLLSRTIYRITYLLDLTNKSLFKSSPYPSYSILSLDSFSLKKPPVRLPLSPHSSLPLFNLVWSLPFEKESFYSFTNGKQLGSYCDNFIALAKQKRFLTQMTPVSPLSQITLAKLSAARSYISFKGQWLKADSKNIWLKSFTPSAVYNHIRLIDPFISVKNFNVPDFIRYSPLLHLSDLKFQIDTPLIWQFNRFSLFNNVVPSLLTWENGSTSYVSTARWGERNRENFTPTSTIISQLSLPSLPPYPLAQSPQRQVSNPLPPHSIDYPWSLWSPEIAYELSRLYLTTQSIYPSLRHISRPKSKRIYFKNK